MWFHSPPYDGSGQFSLLLNVGNSTVDCVDYFSYKPDPEFTGFTTLQVANDLQVNIKVSLVIKSLTLVYSLHSALSKHYVSAHEHVRITASKSSHTICFSENEGWFEFEYQWGECNGCTWRSAVSVCSGEDWVQCCYLYNQRRIRSRHCCGLTHCGLTHCEFKYSFLYANCLNLLLSIIYNSYISYKIPSFTLYLYFSDKYWFYF